MSRSCSCRRRRKWPNFGLSGCACACACAHPPENEFGEPSSLKSVFDVPKSLLRRTRGTEGGQRVTKHKVEQVKGEIKIGGEERVGRRGGRRRGGGGGSRRKVQRELQAIEVIVMVIRWS